LLLAYVLIAGDPAAFHYLYSRDLQSRLLHFIFQRRLAGYGHERYHPAHGHDDHRRGDEKDRGFSKDGL
jgi:hypothetical protein